MLHPFFYLIFIFRNDLNCLIVDVNIFYLQIDLNSFYY